MKIQLKILLSTILILLGLFACKTKTTLSTVSSVDLKRYAGTWYEIASYPQFFERGCTNVKATYTPKKDYIEVLNQSIKKGKPNSIKGKAFVVKNSGNARLKVQFFGPFKGNYWINNLGHDYSWAVVSDPKRKTLWILSRTSKMDSTFFNSIVDKLVKNGFNKNKIIPMVQD